MKKLIVIATLILLSSVSSVRAESVSCTAGQYGGAVCGVETSSETKVELKIVETAASDSQMIKLLLSIAGAAALATGLYKLTYKSYIFG